MVGVATAIDVAGMPPQIEIVMQIAAERHLRVICSGHSGEAQVLRLASPKDKIDRVVGDELHRVVGQTWAVPGDKTSSKTCDHESPVIEDDGEPPFGDPKFAPAGKIMMAGSSATLKPILAIAVSCGFTQAYVRPINDVDRAYFGRASNAPRVESDWEILDAGGNTSRHYPVLCFIKLSYRALHKQG